MTAGIPIVNFDAYGEDPSVYHQPSDDIYRITPEVMENLAQIIFIGIIELTNQ
ncbi:MAG: Zn-dependent exopeptidase M28 [Bacteroidetes bacterium]|nr:Zn-dependent exopeptidase M28 [Bacteroidota bacterium]